MQNLMWLNLKKLTNFNKIFYRKPGLPSFNS